MKQLVYGLVIFFLLVSVTPLVSADNSISDAREVEDGYDDFWWLCYDDDCTEGPSWENGVDQIDWYKIKTYPGDSIKWEVYNRADPHYTWIGAQFFDSSGNVVAIQDDPDSDSRSDFMWIGDYETDSRTISWSGGSCSGYWTYMRLHAEDDIAGDGSIYDVRIDVDTSGRTCSNGDSTYNDGNSDSSSCPYREGQFGTKTEYGCIYTDIPGTQNQDTSSSDYDFSWVSGARLAIYGILITIFVITGIIKSVSGRKSKKSNSTTSTENYSTDYSYSNPSVNSYNAQYGTDSYLGSPVTNNVQQDTLAAQITANNQVNTYDQYTQNSGYNQNGINVYPVQIPPPPPTGPPPVIPSGPSKHLNGEYDDRGYQWLQWNANSRWYWRIGANDEWKEFKQ